MKRRLFSYRTALVALVAGLVIVVAGDRGTRAQTGIQGGIDPLEVLNLQIKPNVLIAFDSSGSMNDNLDDTQSFGADYKHSKMGGGKRVLKQAIADNASKITFMFGQYRQEGSGPRFNNGGFITNPGTRRFSYWVRNDDCGLLPCPSVTMNPIYAYQTISDAVDTNPVNNNVLYFIEENGGADLNCAVPIPAGFYTSGATLATAMATAMNGCPGKANTYNVTYTAGTGVFTFARTMGPRTFRMQWSNGTNSIRAVLNSVTGDTGNGTSFNSGNARIMALERGITFSETVLGVPYTHQQMNSNRFWNGETIYALSSGTICGQAATVTPTVPPTVYWQEVVSCASLTTTGPAVPFGFAGGYSGPTGATSLGQWSGASNTCDGFKVRLGLNVCDEDPAPQVAAVTTPYLQDQWEYEQTAGPNFGKLKRYLESTDGTARMVDPDGAGPLGPTSVPNYGMAANGSTPIGNSLRDLKTIFQFLYSGGAVPPTPPGPISLPPSGAINTHVTPRERTLVMFITDGDDTCSGSTADGNALSAAGRAEYLYEPLVGGLNADGTFTAGTDPASSVTTYLVGFGLGSSVNRLNWIAWGGSGMQKSTGGAPWASIPTAGERAACATCIDAFIAPDAATLANALQAIFDQGAQTGEFTAQQSLDGAPFEYVDRAGAFRSDDPTTRFRGITPTRYLASFELPGFKGHLKALQNSGPPGFTTLTRWDAGQVLTTSVTAGMSTCTRPGADSPALTGNCFWDELHGSNTNDLTVGTSVAKIKRKIYTTTRNGYYNVAVTDLVGMTPPAGVREVLWPPTTSVAPNSDSLQGSLDVALGLPLNSHPNPTAAFAELQRDFKACLGTPLSGAAAGCAGASTILQKMQRARREAREMILAFMAGAQARIDNGGNPLRVTSGGRQGQIIYQARSWVLADSTLATPAIIGPPLESRPTATNYLREYDLFRDGPRPMTATIAQQGFGLRNPDRGLPPNTGPEAVMTVAYAPANDMLHAFRAGPNVAPSNTCNPSTDECGGQELWGFVPFDRLGPYCVKDAGTRLCTLEPAPAVNKPVVSLGTLGSRLINTPQKRAPHDYMIARGVRVADVFIRGTVSVPNDPVPAQGVWRRVLLFGRGAGGKYMTALDITAPGPFTMRALQTVPPIPLWSRGNPDTNDGTPAPAGTLNNNAADYAAYEKMGQTWSLPAIGFADKNFNGTIRTPAPPGGPGIEFIGYMGSGYGLTGEGTTYYTFDVLTGDIIAAVDIGSRTGPGTPTYSNALVANAAAYSPSRFASGAQPHPAATLTTRVYLGDLHGRLWKFLTAKPDRKIPMADLGGTQPVAVAVGLLGFDPLGASALKPHIYAVSGHDSRASGPFGAFGFRDDNPDDTDESFTATPISETGIGTPALTIDVFPQTVVLRTPATASPPNVPFIRTFEQGPKTNAGAPGPDPVFRGTAQPASALAAPRTAGGPPLATAFFAGTRFNPPGSAYAPDPPPYPCRSTFDTIIYVLEGDTGAAAYDLNTSGDDAYSIFRGSRTVAIGMREDPGNTSSGSKFERDEGLITGTPPPPPPPGLPPGSADVRIEAKPGRPMPTFKFGSTVCQ